MVGIVEFLKDFKTSWYYEKRLKKVQEKASLHPENPLIQVRLADLLVKLKKKKEAVSVYELAAEQFMKTNLFAHAIALKKIIFRLEPPGDEGEQINALERMYYQMLVYREKTSIAEEAKPAETPAPSCRPSERRRGELQLEPKAILQIAP